MSGSVGIPPGHTPFSWLGGQEDGATSRTSPPPSHTPFSWLAPLEVCAWRPSRFVGLDPSCDLSTGRAGGASNGACTLSASAHTSGAGGRAGGTPTVAAKTHTRKPRQQLTHTEFASRLDALARTAASVRGFDALSQGSSWSDNQGLTQETEPLRRVFADLKARNVLGSVMVRTPPDYYAWQLHQRAALLKCTTAHLCKTLILENVAHDSSLSSNATKQVSSRYICVVIQYERKLDNSKLATLLRKQAVPALPASRFEYQVAPEDVSLKLAGFSHNAVTLYGMLEEVPVVVTKSVASLTPAVAWLGGGEVEVKLRVPVSQLVSSCAALVLDCDLPR